ncbi:MAG: hypothetical protein AB1634_19455 [Thermodesulfobacteriota bacterium]
METEKQSARPEEDRLLKVEGQAAAAQYLFERLYRVALPYAEKGLPQAQFDVSFALGLGYGHGKPDPSTEEREQKSLPWLIKAALGGQPEALQTLADCFRNGWRSLPKSAELSSCWKEAKTDKDLIPKCHAMMESLTAGRKPE